MSSILRYIRCVRGVGTSCAHFTINRQKQIANFTIKHHLGSLNLLTRYSSTSAQATQYEGLPPNLIPLQKHRKRLLLYFKAWDPEYKKYYRFPDNRIGDNVQIDAAQNLLFLFNKAVFMPRSERVSAIKDIWNFIVKHDCLNVQHCNQLLYAYTYNNMEFSPTDFLLIMREKNIQPDSTTYLRLMKYYCSKGNVKDAMYILETMRNNNMYVREEVYTSLIIGYAQAGDLNGACEIAEALQQSYKSINNYIYSSLMNAYAMHNDIDKIKEIYNKSISSDIHLNDAMVLPTIYTLIKNNYTENINELLSYFKCSISYENFTYTVQKVIDIEKPEVALDMILHYLNILEPDTAYSFVTEVLMTRIMEHCEFKKIYSHCKETGNLHFILASLKAAFTICDESDALMLMDLLHTLNYPLKPHFFWPLLTKSGNPNHYQGILKILKLMTCKFNVTPCVDTLKDFVLPFSFGDGRNLYEFLLDLHVPKDTINNAFVHNYLQTQKVRYASVYMQKNPCNYSYAALKYVLPHAVFLTQDVEHYLQIICQLCDPRYESDQRSNNGDSLDSHFVRIQTGLEDLIMVLPNCNLLLLKIAETLEGGAKIPERAYKEISEFLDKWNATHDINPSLMLKAPCLAMKKYSLSNDIDGAQRIIKVIEDRPVKHQRIAEVHLTYAQILIMNDKFEEAKTHLTKLQSMDIIRNDVAHNFWTNVITKLDRTQIHSLVDLLKSISNSTRYITFISALCSAYIDKNNLVEAEKFYHSLPSTYQTLRCITDEYYKAYIRTNNVRMLQKFVDYATKLMGQEKVLWDLIYHFINENKIRQAEKSLTMITESRRSKHVQDCLQSWKSSRNEKSLETFINIVKTKMPVFTLYAYDILLDLYEQRNESRKALEVWNSIRNCKKSENLWLHLEKRIVHLLKKNNEHDLLNNDCVYSSSAAPATGGPKSEANP